MPRGQILDDNKGKRPKFRGRGYEGEYICAYVMQGCTLQAGENLGDYFTLDAYISACTPGTSIRTFSPVPLHGRRGSYQGR